MKRLLGLLLVLGFPGASWSDLNLCAQAQPVEEPRTAISNQETPPTPAPGAAAKTVPLAATGGRHGHLTGQWIGNYSTQGEQVVRVVTAGDILIAIKLTGDSHVPAGNPTWWANLTTKKLTWHIATQPGGPLTTLPGKLLSHTRTQLVCQTAPGRPPVVFRRGSSAEIAALLAAAKKQPPVSSANSSRNANRRGNAPFAQPGGGRGDGGGSSGMDAMTRGGRGGTSGGRGGTSGGRAGTVASAASAIDNPLAIGKHAPEIEGEDLDGIRFKLSDYRGKVIVLDFWGDW